MWVVCLSEAEWLLLKRVLAEHIERHGRTAMSDAVEAMLEGAFTVRQLRTLTSLVES